MQHYYTRRHPHSSSLGTIYTTYGIFLPSFIVGSDVVERELVVVITAGSTVGMVSIDLINDETAEEVETFTLALSIMTPESELLAKLGQPSEATVRVVDDDVVTVEFERERYVVDENADTVSLRVVSSRAATYDVLVEFAVTDVLATSECLWCGHC